MSLRGDPPEQLGVIERARRARRRSPWRRPPRARRAAAGCPRVGAVVEGQRRAGPRRDRLQARRPPPAPPPRRAPVVEALAQRPRDRPDARRSWRERHQRARLVAGAAGSRGTPIDSPPCPTGDCATAQRRGLPLLPLGRRRGAAIPDGLGGTVRAPAGAAAARGLRGGDLATLEALAAGREPGPTVFLTFDDGFRDNHETVLPLLREWAARPSCSSCRRWWTRAERWSGRRCGRPGALPGDDALGQLGDAGGDGRGRLRGRRPHAHPSAPAGARRRGAARGALRVAGGAGRALGGCDTLAYPFGEWSPAVAAAAAECGYRFAFTLPTVTASAPRRR